VGRKGVAAIGALVVLTTLLAGSTLQGQEHFSFKHWLGLTRQPAQEVVVEYASIARDA